MILDSDHNSDYRWRNIHCAEYEALTICEFTGDYSSTTTTTTSSTTTTTQASPMRTTFDTSKWNIMVAIGYNGKDLDHVEVFNMETLSPCHNLPAPFPKTVSQGVAIKHDSKPVICGGHPLSTDCYSYANNSWTLESFKFEPARYYALAVELRPGVNPNEWLVLGGADGSNLYKDCQIFKNGAFVDCPDYPERNEGGSAALLNDTHVFVAGGNFQPSEPKYSKKNYLFDIKSERWIKIADRIEDNFSVHASGTFYNSTANEIQVANVGRKNIQVYSPKADSWHFVRFPHGVTELFISTAVQLGTDSFVLIGGRANYIGYSGDIFKFDENGMSILKKDAIIVPRRGHVAFPIATDDFTCNDNNPTSF